MATKALTKKQTAEVVARFTEDELKNVYVAAAMVWQAVGDDYLQLGSRSVPRREVIEVVSDANRLEDELKARGRRLNRLPEFEALVAKVGKLNYEEAQALLKPAFPYARYGY